MSIPTNDESINWSLAFIGARHFISGVANGSFLDITAGVGSVYSAVNPATTTGYLYRASVIVTSIGSFKAADYFFSEYNNIEEDKVVKRAVAVYSIWAGVKGLIFACRKENKQESPIETVGFSVPVSVEGK